MVAEIMESSGDLVSCVVAVPRYYHNGRFLPDIILMLLTHYAMIGEPDGIPSRDFVPTATDVPNYNTRLDTIPLNY